jgi:hypothetical protein
MSVRFREIVDGKDRLAGERQEAVLGDVVVGVVRVLDGAASWRSYLPHDGVTGGPCQDVSMGKRMLGEHVGRWIVAARLKDAP